MGPRGLLDVKCFFVPESVLDLTFDALAAAGEQEVEGMVVWGGVRDSDHSFRFHVAYGPRQRAYKTEHGLLVRVDADALDDVNRAFNARGLILGGQAHSHPTDAYHSDTDDARPLVTLLGGLSLVVPDFARGGRADLDRCAWYRLYGYADWRPIGLETGITIG
jgi:hypothetical protein